MPEHEDEDIDPGRLPAAPRTLTESERFKVASRLTEREREQHAARWASGVPVVAGAASTWEPHQLIDQPPTEAELELMHQLRAMGDRPHRLAEFVAKLTLRLSQQRRDEISANEAMLQELRDLLNKPPNGRVGELAKQHALLAQQLGTIAGQLAEHTRTGLALEGRVGDLARKAEEREERMAELEAIPKAVNRKAWATVIALFVTILGSAVAIHGAISSTGEARGRQLEQMEMIRWRLDRLDGQPRHDDTATRWLVPPQQQPQPPQSKGQP